jgi:hypothetical protein
MPEAWEWRELTGRDYGIDMELEPFEEGDTQGRLLLLQIKGRRGLTFAPGEEVGLSLESNALQYAERFVSPIVVCLCPIDFEPTICRFIWLQEYIRVRLADEQPDWRAQRTVRVRLPSDNQMPGAQNRLEYIANYPRRLESWGHLARL